LQFAAQFFDEDLIEKFAQEESKDELLVKVAFAFGNFILPK
jgi:hypothetical protein